MYPYDYLIYNDYLMHHGILGQKWGIRRFQNADGSLTAEGQARYRTHSVKGNIGRALTYTSVGQRLLGVGVNKGYRTDRKEIKSLYKAEKEKINSKDISDEEKKKELKSLKKDYKLTKGEARVSAAEALYPWQSKNANEKIQTQNLGKQFVKSLLFGGLGAKNYDVVTADSKLESEAGKKAVGAAAGLASDVANYYTLGGVALGDYIYSKVSSEKKNKANGTYSKQSTSKKTNNKYTYNSLEELYGEKDSRLNSYIKKADAAKTDEEKDKWMAKYEYERDKKAGLIK